MNKDFLYSGTSAANQYEGGYDVRKNHEQAIHKITKYMQGQGAIIDKYCPVKMILKEGDILVQNCTQTMQKIKRTHIELFTTKYSRKENERMGQTL